MCGTEQTSASAWPGEGYTKGASAQRASVFSLLPGFRPAHSPRPAPEWEGPEEALGEEARPARAPDPDYLQLKTQGPERVIGFPRVTQKRSEVFPAGCKHRRPVAIICAFIHSFPSFIHSCSKSAPGPSPARPEAQGVGQANWTRVTKPQAVGHIRRSSALPSGSEGFLHY